MKTYFIFDAETVIRAGLSGRIVPKYVFTRTTVDQSPVMMRYKACCIFDETGKVYKHHINKELYEQEMFACALSAIGLDECPLIK